MNNNIFLQSNNQIPIKTINNIILILYLIEKIYKGAFIIDMFFVHTFTPQMAMPVHISVNNKNCLDIVV